MAIYFVQHGICEAKTMDPDRPLTHEGRKEIKRVAIHLPVSYTHLRAHETF